MKLTTEQLEVLTREEVLAMFKVLPAEVEELRERVSELEVENERLRTQSSNSRNSSQPPSRDQKGSQPEKKGGKQGPPFGHGKYRREMIEKPDRVISVGVEQCRECRADMRAAMPEGIDRQVGRCEFCFQVRSVSKPRIAEPRIAEPRIAEPRIAEPRIAEPRIADCPAA